MPLGSATLLRAAATDRKTRTKAATKRAVRSPRWVRSAGYKPKATEDNAFQASPWLAISCGPSPRIRTQDRSIPAP